MGVRAPGRESLCVQVVKLISILPVESRLLQTIFVAKSRGLLVSTTISSIKSLTRTTSPFGILNVVECTVQPWLSFDHIMRKKAKLSGLITVGTCI